MPKTPTFKILLLILGIALIIIGLGIALGIYYAALPGHHPQESKSACESVGGDWSTEQNICLLSYKEGGETCTDGGQCISGVCSPPKLTAEQKDTISKEPLNNIVGTCYAGEPTGCVPQVLLGTVSKESMCGEAE